MTFPKRFCVLTILLMLGAGPNTLATPLRAQELDFSRFGAFESIGNGTARVGSAPKTIVDDGEQHIVFVTIWDADTDTKVYWKPLDGTATKTTVIHGTGVRAFQTDGVFKIEAVGPDGRSVKYDYVLLALRKE